MREIMFRGKRVDNGKWIIHSETYIRDGDGIWLSDNDRNVEKVIPETVGQFTGLTDKNGRMIYEDDIVWYKAEIYRVVFEQRNSTAYFGITLEHIRPWQFCEGVLSAKMAVIGNVHDNPELLKEVYEIERNFIQSANT